MIAYLNGKITHKNPAFLYVECSGVGYQVNISLQTYEALEKLNEVKIFTYQHIYENGQVLYGFFSEEEKAMFIHLISVSGVGPNTARVILSYLNLDDLKSAIINGNVKALSSVKGIGAKTAQRIIIDLKEKVIKDYDDVSVVKSGSVNNTMKDEALSALMALGFPKVTVEKHINTILTKNSAITQVEDLIKEVLKMV
ncbi:MAG TPA: Holliday junction branch migration protein RuvA [Saprospiraceae bacterium]|nr:Holliday junction branch migration protein RuvA [Saprospiraceae bacterium]MCB9327626.1 Holliday junction branch migration protein RuvA [Lewinellaceae bacterium]HPK10296.1 Holliday junction branch migration protein RuvA [Saprospiraceae bacterium]HPQ20417.1 Holliday junction branch migration protein RuvA [Saprospiraceae bacterium]HRX27766.1 Holliday junction branch migration protein RuvA [Saprospiraceae bacterium]